ncbi:MAG: hypothetical protein IJ829_07915 [Kiritimatiellae bacterium]|nr:hypothetical protein [Kiritimatiellia bacterium]
MIVATAVIALAVFLCVVGGCTPLETIGWVILALVVAVPLLIAIRAKEKQLAREREAVRRQAEAARRRGNAVDWSKARDGTPRYHEPYLDHGIRKPYHTGKIKEAHKPPSADAP